MKKPYYLVTAECSSRECRDCRFLLQDGRCVLDLAANGPLSQRAIAKLLGVSRSRVYQIEKMALGKFRSKFMRLETRAI